MIDRGQVHMKKIISAVVASVLCTGAFVSCGDKEKEKGSKDGTLSTKGKSEYTAIIPLDGNSEPIKESIDGGIKYSINRAKEFRKENDAEYNPWVIKFSDDKFVMPIDMSRSRTYCNGNFSIKDGAIKFSYEDFIDPNNDTKTNINDKVEYDEDIIKVEYDEGIIKGKSDKLDGLSDEEKKEMRKKEQEKINAAAVIERMEKLNKTGAYCKYAVPGMNMSDKWNDFTLLPFIRWTRGTIMDIDRPNTLKTVDKFLCTDTYGIELEGKYKKGKDFTLKHDLEETLEEDEQSYIGSSEERLEETLERAEMNYHCDDLDSTIEFSDGEWEWYNADDELLNNGKYEESRKYPGLIKMYIDEDSEKHPVYAENTYPLWFYIADDGEIYYPAFVKVE